MGLYRKKPVTVEVQQWDGTTSSATVIIGWIRECGATARYADEIGVFAIDTLEGTMFATPGDWIIKGVKGEFYPCREDIFEATYETAEDRPEQAKILGADGRWHDMQPQPASGEAAP